jgi:RNase P/RNase MRP subunit POP5
LTKHIRRRYLALKVDGQDQSFDLEEVSDSIWNSVLHLFGEVGVSQAGLYLVRFEEKKSYVVLRCSHRALPMVKAAIASVTKIGKSPAAIHVLRVSGTLKTLVRKASDH